MSHHASKHGINLELMERVNASMVLVSSTGGGGRYGFPHALAMDAARPLSEAHALASKVEERIRRAHPEIADVVVHTEP